MHDSHVTTMKFPCHLAPFNRSSRRFRNLPVFKAHGVMCIGVGVGMSTWKYYSFNKSEARVFTIFSFWTLFYEKYTQACGVHVFLLGSHRPVLSLKYQTNNPFLYSHKIHQITTSSISPVDGLGIYFHFISIQECPFIPKLLGLLFLACLIICLSAAVSSPSTWDNQSPILP